jgi:hypothetical protein
MSPPLTIDGSNDSNSNSKNFEAGESKTYEEEEVRQIESADIIADRPGFGQKTKRHCARFWWLHLAIFCISFLIIALCLTYVAMPRIAQKGVNESSIEFTDLEFLEPTSDSIVLTQSAILHSPSIYTPTLDPFNASLYLVENGVYSSAPMMYIPMPSIHALHPSSNVSIKNEQLAIANLAELTKYATAVLSQENVTTALVGSTRLHEGKLPVNTITFNSTSTYKGLNGLQGFNVTDVKINVTAPAGQPNLLGYAYIPNPSLMTIAMGNVTLTLSTALAGVVGNSTIDNMTLVPGNNTLPMYGTVNQTGILSSLDKSGYVNMIITGQSAIYNGQHLTYYESALASNVLTLQMNVFQILTDSAKSA